VLATHVDSVPGAPGAADAGVGLAVILETVRALGPEAGRNDLVVLIVDGEEDGLLGSLAYVEEAGVDLREPVVVLNHEARGTSGRPVVSRWDGPMHQVLPTMPSPEAESFTDALFTFIPNDTDFTEYRAAGWWGMDMAVVGDSWAYHSPQDDAEHLDPATLQHFGETTLAMSEDLLGRDLGALDGAAPPPVVTTAPWGLLAVPTWTVFAAAVLGVLTALFSTALHTRYRNVTWRGTFLGMVGGLLTVVLAVTLAVGAWWAMGRIAPSMLSVVMHEPVIAWPFLLGEGLLVAVAGRLVMSVLGRRLNGDALALGTALSAAFLAAGLSGLSPHLGGWLQLPVTLILLGGLGADLLRRRGRHERPSGPSATILPVLLATITALPLAWLLGSQASTLMEFGMASSNGMLAGVLALGVSLILAVLARQGNGEDAKGWRSGARVPAGSRTGEARRRRRPAVLVAFVVLVLVADGTGILLNARSGEPTQERVVAQIDGATGQGDWETTRNTTWGAELNGKSLQASDLPAPRCEIVSVEQRAPESSWVRVRASSPRGSTRLTLDIQQGTMQGTSIEEAHPSVPGAEPAADGMTSWRIVGLETGQEVELIFRWDGAPSADHEDLAAGMTCTDETFDPGQIPGFPPPGSDVSLVQPSIRVTTSAIAG
jgi:hypothetical protein